MTKFPTPTDIRTRINAEQDQLAEKFRAAIAEGLQKMKGPNPKVSVPVPEGLHFQTVIDIRTELQNLLWIASLDEGSPRDPGYTLVIKLDPD